MKKLIKKVKNINGISELIKQGEVFLVGGIVRDHFLNKKSKDIDLLVRTISLNNIKDILSKFGKIDEVGESFGVLKFRPDGWKEEEIDIALPRIDKKIGDGHKGIESVTNPFLSIEEDLKRRDIRINSITINLNTEQIVDPFNGMQDLKDGIIRATSPKAFSEDPLRMMRTIGFSSRFGFEIEEGTWNMILENKEEILDISGERIHDELVKIFEKGDIQQGLNLFSDSGIHSLLFPNKIGKLSKSSHIKNIKTIEDFFFVICGNPNDFKEVLKGEKNIEKGIQALLNFSFGNIKMRTAKFDVSDIRQLLFDSIQKSESILESGIVENNTDRINEFRDGTMPKSTRDLALDGNDLMELGFKGVEIKNRFDFFLSEIFSEKRENNKADLLR